MRLVSFFWNVVQINLRQVEIKLSFYLKFREKILNYCSMKCISFNYVFVNYVLSAAQLSTQSDIIQNSNQICINCIHIIYMNPILKVYNSQ